MSNPIAADPPADPITRPAVLPGQTYKLYWAESAQALYVTVNDIEQDGRRRPFEVIINSRNMEHFAWSVALTRMISAVFRRDLRQDLRCGGDLSFVAEELKAVFDPRGGQWMAGRYVPSLPAAIGGILEAHMRSIDAGAPVEQGPAGTATANDPGNDTGGSPAVPDRVVPASFSGPLPVEERRAGRQL